MINHVIGIMNEPFANMKKFKIFDELFLAITNGKMVLKDLKNPKEHQTISFIPNGIVDVHKTKEGSKDEKEYESIGQFDLLKMMATLASNPNDLIQSLEQTMQSMKEVNFNESEYEQLRVVPMKTSEEILPFVIINKKRVDIPIESLNDLNFLENHIPWKEAGGKIKENAIVLNGELTTGYIFRKEGKFLYLPTDNIMNIPLVQLFQKGFENEKLDHEISKEENEERRKFMNELMKDSKL